PGVFTGYGSSYGGGLRAESQGPEACWSFGDRRFHTGWTVAAPAARGVPPGGRICPAAAGETAGPQALLAGAAALGAVPAARGG
ncbi:unnamed protein product, partial [Ectocarpus sp. 4 AP-2014]